MPIQRILACFVIGLFGLLPNVGQAQNTNVSSATPIIAVETSVPAEIDIGQTARFVITVKNSGKSGAEGVSVQTALPPDVEFVRANPAPALQGNNLIQFEVGDLPMGARRQFVLELIPQRLGPVNLKTRAFFSTSTQAALQVREPKISIQCHGPDAARVGDAVTFRVVVQNIGDGNAREVLLKPELPEASHISTHKPNSTTIPILQAGESKEFQFVARAIDQAWLEANFVASLHEKQEVECGRRVRILHPALDVELTGTRVGYLKSEGEYEVRVSNPGDILHEGVHVVLNVPEGLDVTTLSNAASMSTDRRTYRWCLPELHPGDSHVLMLKANGNNPGTLIQHVKATTALDLIAEDDHRTTIINRPDVDVAVLNSDEALEVGEVETFTVWLINRGSKTAGDVKVEVQMPDGMLPVNSEQTPAFGRTVTFRQIRLAPGEERKLKFQAAGQLAGERVVRAVVTSAHSSQPTIAETSVYFYDEVELERVANQANDARLLR